MRFYSDLEVDLLIEEITEAAHEAIEMAAARAAQAALLASLEREAAAYAEAQRYRGELAAVKENAVKNIVIAVLAGMLSGFVIHAAVSK